MPSSGRTSTVRSHRRGGPRRRFPLGTVLVIAVLLVLGGGVTAGVVLLKKDSCSGSSTATVVVAPTIQTIMAKLAQDWASTNPNVDGVCGAVAISTKESADMVGALSTADWDPGQGPAPDVWVPESSAWVRKASVDADAERIMPDLPPSLARTPTVIAMPRPLAEAAKMTDTPLTWRQIVDKLSSTKGWTTFQHPEWGSFKIALSDPQSSTPGLLALMAISDTDDDGEVTPAEQATLLDLKKVISLKAERTDDIITGLQAAADKGTNNGLTYVSAFPALEEDVLAYNLTQPKVPLVAIYPQDGLAEADFPYLVLNAKWGDNTRRDVADAFGRFARGAQGKAAFQGAGFRDSNRVPGPAITPANGVSAKLTALPRAVLLPESVQHAAASWTAVTRPTNLLFVFDTSGSMGTEVLGTGKTRLDLTKAAALGALDLFDDTAQVGVWEFSTVTNGKDYRQLLPLGVLAKNRDQVEKSINNLQAGGNTGLYNTTAAACQYVENNYLTNSTNLVVLLTDGADDNNVVGGLTLDALLNSLATNCGNAQKPVQVITVGLGTSTNSDILKQISAATKAPTFSSPNTFDVSQVVLSAIFGD
jgi:Ca-activated chloride channel family protein